MKSISELILMPDPKAKSEFYDSSNKNFCQKAILGSYIKLRNLKSR